MRNDKGHGDLPCPFLFQCYERLLFGVRRLTILDFEWLDEFEVEQGFGVDGDVAVAGEGCAAGARGCAHQAADQCALAAASEATDEGAATSATACERGGALALAGAGFGRCGGCDFIGFVFDRDVGQGERENGAALEASCGLCVFHDTGSVSSLGDRKASVDR